MDARSSSLQSQAAHAGPHDQDSAHKGKGRPLTSCRPQNKGDKGKSHIFQKSGEINIRRFERHHFRPHHQVQDEPQNRRLFQERKRQGSRHTPVEYKEKDEKGKEKAQSQQFEESHMGQRNFGKQE